MEENSIKEKAIVNKPQESGEGESNSINPISQSQQQQQMKTANDETAFNAVPDTFTESYKPEPQQNQAVAKDLLEKTTGDSLSEVKAPATVPISADTGVSSSNKTDENVDKSNESKLPSSLQNSPDNMTAKASSDIEIAVDNDNKGNDEQACREKTDLNLDEATSKTDQIDSEQNVIEGSKLKMRLLNVNGAPKMPATGYVRYMNERRESIRKDHPNRVLSKVEVVRLIEEEWKSLSMDIKATYIKAAALDKQRYIQELNNFMKSYSDSLANDLTRTKRHKPLDNQMSKKTKLNTAAKERPKVKKSQVNQNCGKNNKTKRKSTPSPAPSSAVSAASSSTNINSTNTTTTSSATMQFTPGEIPIFTNEFLEHNKIYDMELKTLRKSKIDLEQQNAALEKYVENMKSGVENMVSENKILQEKNQLLELYLDKLKRKLAHALSTLPLPTQPSGANMDNIDKYMMDLYKMTTSNKHSPAILSKAKDIIRKLDLQIQF